MSEELKLEYQELLAQYDLNVLSQLLGESGLKEDLLNGLEKILKKEEFLKPSFLLDSYVTKKAVHSFAEKSNYQKSPATLAYSSLLRFHSRKKGIPFSDKAMTYRDLVKFIKNKEITNGFAEGSRKFMLNFLQYSGIKLEE